MDVTDLFPRNDSLVSFKPGQAVFKEGEPGDVMFILIEGVVDVVVGEKVVGSFEPIEILGEMSVIEPGPRSATVVAKTHCKLGAVNQKRFNFLCQNKPDFAVHIMRMLVERMRWMDQSAKTNRTVDTEKMTQLEEKIAGLNATIQAQADQIHALQQQLEAEAHPEHAVMVA